MNRLGHLGGEVQTCFCMNHLYANLGAGFRVYRGCSGHVPGLTSFLMNFKGEEIPESPTLLACYHQCDC